MIAVLGGMNLIVVFACELATMAAFSVWGLQVAAPPVGRWSLAIGAPVAAMIVWGTFCAPAAGVALPPSAVVVIKLAILAAAVAALTVARRPGWAVALAVVAIASGLLDAVLPNPWAAGAPA